MTSARFTALLCAQLISTAAWAQTVSFDLPSTDIVNRSNVAFLAFGGSCSNVGEQVGVSGPSGFSATAQCRDTGRWDIANVSLTHLGDGMLTFTVSHATATPVSRTLRKDTVAPALSLQQPTNGSSINATNQGALPVRGTCGDLNQPVTVSARPATANAPLVEQQLTCPASRSFSTTLDVSGLPDGDTQIFVQHRDAAGNTAQQDIILYKDSEPILVTIAPIGAYIPAEQSASLQFNGTCNKPGEALFLDVTGPSGYLASLITYCGADQTWGFANVSVTDAPDEELTFMATLTHSLTGGFASAQLTALKDTAPPVLTLLEPVHGTRVTSATGTALRVSGTCSDPTPVSVAVAGGTALETPCQAGAFSVLYELGGLADGDVTLRVLQEDVAGNVGRQDISLLKDVQPASVSVLQPAPGSFINAGNAASVLFTGTCSEHGSFAEPVLLEGAVSASALCVAGSWSVTLSLTQLPEGPVSVRVVHGDTAGNTPAEVLLALVKDVVPPVLQLTSPSPAPGQQALVNAANVDALEILGSCSEDGQALAVSGARTGTVSCTGGAFMYRPELRAVPDGDVLLHFTLTDAAGNSATQSLGIYKDTLPPVITLAGGDPLVLNADTAVELALTGECSEYGAFASSVHLVGPVAAQAACMGGGWALMLSLSGVQDGAGTFRLEHRDAAGNLAVLERAYVKDTVPPVLTLTSPGEGFLVNSGNQHAVPVSGTCDMEDRYVTLLTTAGLAMTRCTDGAFEATLDLTGAPDGDVMIRARLEDALGNATVQDAIVFKDAAPPALTLSNVGDPLPLNATSAPDTLLTGECSEHGDYAAPVQLVAPVVASAACNAGTWSLHVSLAELPDAAGTLEFVHTDRAGNVARLARAYVKDTVAPLLSISQPGPGFFVRADNAAAVRVAGTCNEEGRPVELSGPVAATALCTAGQYSVEVNLSAALDGDLTLRAKLSDAVGNTTVQDVRVHKDTLPPALALSNVGDPLVLNGTTSGGLLLFGECSEQSTPVELVAPVSATAACAGVTWSLMVSLTDLPDGTGSLALEHRDVAGNVARLTRAYRKDTAAPALALTRPGVNERINAGNQQAVQVAGTCNEEGRPVEVTSPVAASAPCSGGQFSLALNLSGVPDGDVAIRTRLTDAAGNETRQDVLVLKDTVLPTITLANAGNPLEVPATPGATLVLSGSCSEHGSAAQPVRLLSPVTATAACTTGSWSLQLNTDTIPMGQGSLELSHADLAGNTTRVVRTYLKEPPIPKLTVTSPAAGGFITSSPRIEGTCSEQGRTVALLAPVTASTTCWSGRFSLYAYIWSIPDGPVTLRLQHTNSLGTATTQEVMVTKDTVYPTLTVTQPAGWDLGQSETLTLQGTCSEPGRPVLIRGSLTAEATCTETKTFAAVIPLTTWGSLTVDLEHRDAADNRVTARRTFERCQYTPRVPNPRVGTSGFMVRADFNADGVMDLATVSRPGSAGQSGPNGVKVYLGRAGGGFDAPTIIEGMYPGSLTVADFNADGALDIMVSEHTLGAKLLTGKKVNGQPSGTFNPPFHYAGPKTYGNLVAAKINDDDFIDLVAVNGPPMNPSSGVSVSYGRQACGPGIDFDPPVLVHSATSTNYQALDVADLNGDGRADITLAAYSGPVDVLLRTGTAGGPVTFQLTQLATPSGRFSAYRVVRAADLNADSRMDLAVLNDSYHTVSVAYGLGSGTFTALKEHPITPYPTELTFADVDANGHQDLVVAGLGGVMVLPGQPSSDPGAYTLGPARGYPTEKEVRGLVVMDANGDGITDFVTSENWGERLAIQHRSTASLEPEPFHPAVSYGSTSTATQHLVSADFDSDGILDVASAGTGGVYILRGKGTSGVGDGTFEPPGTSVLSGNVSRLVAADFNEDGAADLAALTYNNPGVTILLANGPGATNGIFAAPVTYSRTVPSGSSALQNLVTGDFDGDGVLDLVTGYDTYVSNAGDQGTLQVLLGRGSGGIGNGTFEPVVLVPQGVELNDLAVADFNVDGRSDLAFSVHQYDYALSNFRNEVRVLFGTGSRDSIFGQPVPYSLKSNPGTLVTGDFNADGVLDIVPWMNPIHGPYDTLFGMAASGTPTGAFSVSRTLQLHGSSAWKATVEDYDQDGALDLISLGDRRLELVRRWTAVPGERFSPQVIYPLSSVRYGLAMKDFNEDGILDIAVADGTVSIRLGRAVPGFNAP